MEYIDWAVAHRFDVMDVNVPGYITKEEVCCLVILGLPGSSQLIRVPIGCGRLHGNYE
jgi:hypothetical protein